MAQQLNRDQITPMLLKAFRKHGYEGASLSILSIETGLKRASLYHHFPGGKTEMAQATLDLVLSDFTLLVLNPLQNKQHTPKQRLLNVAQGLAKFYANGANACLIDIFSIGNSNQLFQQQLASCTQNVIDLFTQLAEETGCPQALAQQRGEDMMVSLQGTLVIARTLGSHEVFERFLEDLPDRILAPHS